MSKKFRILLVEDHPIVRQGIKEAFKDERLLIVAEAGNGRDAIRLIKKEPLDLIVLDISIDDYSGTEVLAYIKRHTSDTKTIIHTVHDDANHLYVCLKAGAEGYVVKGDEHASLENAALCVLGGKRYISPSILETLINGYVHAFKDPTDNPFAATTLNQKQLDIVKLITQGCSYSDIGERLSISPKTVANYAGNAMRKPGIRGRANLIAYAINNGIVGDDRL